MSEATQIIAIDGPAGAGKSSAAKEVARRMNFSFLDTGAMYRAATWRAMRDAIDLDDPAALEASTRAMNLDMRENGDGVQVFVDGEDVSAAIRSPEVTALIYKLDQNSAVRRHLVELQRRYGEARPTVAEGRDIGTVVFPKAKCKIYLDASLDERAKRRAKQLEAQGVQPDMAALRRDIHERDEKTKNRKDSPLRQAEDAVRLDTTGMDFASVVETMLRLARERL